MANVAENIRSNPPSITADKIRSMRASLTGQVCARGEPGYDEARTIWNAMIDRLPGVVVRCTSAADVVGAVRFANAHDLDIAVRGGGHNIAGNAVCEGGMLIDLSPMKSVHVDPAAMVPIFFAGLLLGYAFYWTGSLRTSILMHFAFNSVSIVLTYIDQHSAAAAAWEFPGWMIGLCAALTFVCFGLLKRFSPELPEGK